MSILQNTVKSMVKLPSVVGDSSLVPDERDEAISRMGSSVGLFGCGALGAVLWKKHPVLGFIAGMLVGEPLGAVAGSYIAGLTKKV